jgi:hypothetical protein
MEKPTLVQIDQFTKKKLLEWCDIAEKTLKKSAIKRNLQDTMALVNSIRADLKGSEGASISFLTYGRFIEIIGNRQTISKTTNKISIKAGISTKSKPLTKSRSGWYTKTRQGLIKFLAQELITDYASVIASSTANQISNT